MSVNTLDLLCHALAALGRAEDAAVFGRRALASKDRGFATRQPPLRVPVQAPRPFDPNDPAANVIAYALWGEAPRYIAVLAENLRACRHLFPLWTVRVYCDDTVPAAYQADLRRLGAVVMQGTLPPGVPPKWRVLWRLHVASDPAVKRFMVRDADSLLCVRERVAVDEWLRSGKYFHVLRDAHQHTDLMLGGLWGGVGGVLQPLDEMLAAVPGWRWEKARIDRDLLTEVIWPVVRQSVLIHDSAFTGCLDSVPFPPFGTLPPGQHVGQYAFPRLRTGLEE